MNSLFSGDLWRMTMHYFTLSIANNTKNTNDLSALCCAVNKHYDYTWCGQEYDSSETLHTPIDLSMNRLPRSSVACSQVDRRTTPQDFTPDTETMVTESAPMLQTAERKKSQGLDKRTTAAAAKRTAPRGGKARQTSREGASLDDGNQCFFSPWGFCTVNG